VRPWTNRFIVSASSLRNWECPCDTQGIQHFLATHTPLASDVKLPDVPFWTPAQGALLREALLQDSDWAERVDQLSGALRGSVRRKQ
jgi:hypothetical protein